MRKCKNCGNEIPDGTATCPNCRKVNPVGEPLPPWGDKPVLITTKDIEQAISEWDKKMPPEMQGLLTARTITPEESQVMEEKLGKVIVPTLL